MKKILFLTLLFAMSPIWAMEQPPSDYEMARVDRAYSYSWYYYGGFAAWGVQVGLDRTPYNPDGKNQELYGEFCTKSGRFYDIRKLTRHWDILFDKEEESGALLEKMSNVLHNTGYRDLGWSWGIQELEMSEAKKNLCALADEYSKVCAEMIKKWRKNTSVESKLNYFLEKSKTTYAAGRYSEEWFDKNYVVSEQPPQYWVLFNNYSEYLDMLEYKRNLGCLGAQCPETFEPFTINHGATTISFENENQFEEYVRARRYSLFSRAEADHDFLKRLAVPLEHACNPHLINNMRRIMHSSKVAIQGRIEELTARCRGIMVKRVHAVSNDFSPALTLELVEEAKKLDVGIPESIHHKAEEYKAADTIPEFDEALDNADLQRDITSLRCAIWDEIKKRKEEAAEIERFMALPNMHDLDTVYREYVKRTGLQNLPQEQMAIMDRAYSIVDKYRRREVRLTPSPYNKNNAERLRLTLEGFDVWRLLDIDSSDYILYKKDLEAAIKDTNIDEITRILQARDSDRAREVEEFLRYKPSVEKLEHFKEAYKAIIKKYPDQFQSEWFELQGHCVINDEVAPQYWVLFKDCCVYLDALECKKSLRALGLLYENDFEPFSIEHGNHEIRFVTEQQFEQYVRAQRYSLCISLEDDRGFFQRQVPPLEHALHAHLVVQMRSILSRLCSSLKEKIETLQRKCQQVLVKRVNSTLNEFTPSQLVRLVNDVEELNRTENINIEIPQEICDQVAIYEAIRAEFEPAIELIKKVAALQGREKYEAKRSNEYKEARKTYNRTKAFYLENDENLSSELREKVKALRISLFNESTVGNKERRERAWREELGRRVEAEEIARLSRIDDACYREYVETILTEYVLRYGSDDDKEKIEEVSLFGIPKLDCFRRPIVYWIPRKDSVLCKKLFDQATVDEEVELCKRGILSDRLKLLESYLSESTRNRIREEEPLEVRRNREKEEAERPERERIRLEKMVKRMEEQHEMRKRKKEDEERQRNRELDEVRKAKEKAEQKEKQWLEQREKQKARTRFYKTAGVVGLTTAVVAAISYLVWKTTTDSSKNNDAREDERIVLDKRERRVYQP